MTAPEVTPTPVKTPAAKKAAAAKKAPAAKKVATQPAAVKKAPAQKAPAQKQAAQKAAAKPSKPAKPTKAPKAVKPPKAPKAAKPEKIKIVRDSFTMPEADFALIEQIKQRALGWKQPAKKSEVLRAALQALQALPDAKVRKLLADLTPIKKGRPQKPA
jgi:hypothetical protein